ncbi:hypothetical protein FEM33_12030 [Dyadobacter flavalbus]|uniref:Uncharacterized protein n=1 Tax=Dyadobacter flavalbus TaxID=2579942 RepID=A0A5M8QYE0_9BACT|nr:hypothetical protein [Dyadobacter flavalbus]KAA6439012.1 hypothetical protein FEM33_12030 [Dyadobacter flavalbus]
MSRFYFYCFLLFITASCKKDADLLPAIEQFVKNVKVKGAREVKFDHETRIIQIILPADYTDDLVRLDLDMYKGASLVINGSDSLFSAEQVQFHYKATTSVVFNVQRDDTGFTKGYSVLVDHQGKIDAEITSDVLLYPFMGDTSSIIAKVRIKAGVGTISDDLRSPELLTGTLSDPEKSFQITGQYSVSSSLINFISDRDILNASNLLFSLSYNGKNYTIPVPVKISRAPLDAYIPSQFLSIPLTRNRLFTIYGGSFLKDETYRVKITNDAQTDPVWIEATYKNRGKLTFTVPSQLAEGNYLISYYEGDNLISSQSASISDNSKVKTVGLIWTQQSECPSNDVLYQAPQKVRIKAGLDVYAAASPFILQGQYIAVDPNKTLPDLELKNAGHTYVIRAKVNVDACYGDRSYYIYYGAYTIPAHAVGGSYEARFIYADKEHSLTYWNFIEVY